MPKYRLEFILNISDTSTEKHIKNSLVEFAEDIEISLLTQNNTARICDLKIQMLTDEPTVIFDTCAQFGRIKSVKIDEEKVNLK
jgi:dihydroxyacetone kinase-like predicted kinase